MLRLYNFLYTQQIAAIYILMANPQCPMANQTSQGKYLHACKQLHE